MIPGHDGYCFTYAIFTIQRVITQDWTLNFE